MHNQSQEIIKENFTLTKIICTVGPSCEFSLDRLCKYGMSIVRINLSHIKSPTEISDILESIKKVRDNFKFAIGVAFDTCGPDLRLIIREPIKLHQGTVLKITNDVHDANCDGFLDTPCFDILTLGSEFTIDDGSIRMKIERIDDRHIYCKSLSDKMLKMNKSVSMPGVQLDIPKLTRTDLLYLKLVEELKIDYIFASFASSKSDIRNIRRIVGANGPLIIAKIESKESLINFDEILSISDGIMVARGDLLAETGYDNLPSIQRQIINACKKAGKPVIIATQVLENMVNGNLPTRAELSDIGNSVYNEVDAIMLSAETSVATSPQRCVEVLSKTVLTSELSYIEEQEELNRVHSYGFFPGFNDIKFIVILSYLREDTIHIYKKRTCLPIILISNSYKYLASLALYRGVFPFKCVYDLLKCNDVVLRIRMKTLMKEFQEMFNAKKGDVACLLIRQQNLYLSTKLYKL